MMKLFTKILAGCCALAMVFSLAACKDTPADELIAQAMLR